MNENIRFCNEDFLPLFEYDPAKYYNQFNIESATRSVLDSMGDHPPAEIHFRYDDEYRVRATFIVFPDAKEELEVYCIAAVFSQSRMAAQCFFFEVYEDGTIGFIENTEEGRIVRSLNVGKDIDAYFNLIVRCAKPSDFFTSEFAMYYWHDRDEVFRILDASASELPARCVPLLGGDMIRQKTVIGGVKFVLLRSVVDGRFLAIRLDDEDKYQSVKLDDALLLREAVQ